jgi:signal transduction histidine kinase/ActR/RegA family two-component response regulator
MILTRLLAVAEKLGRAEAEADIAEEVIVEGTAALDAMSGGMWIVLPGVEKARLVRSSGYSDALARAFETVPFDADLPLARALRTGEPVFFETREAYKKEYADAERATLPMTGQRVESFVCLPLRALDKTVGALVFAFADERVLDPSERRFLLTLAQICADAVERVRLHEELTRANARLALLAKAGSVLSASLDVGETLRALARLSVPAFADWCAVDVVAGDAIERVAVHHRDPAKVSLGLDLLRKYPMRVGDVSTTSTVIATRQTQWAQTILDEHLKMVAYDEEHLSILRTLGVASAIVVPLLHGDSAIGAVSFVWAESGRAYDATDVALAEELGRRASMAIANARSFRREQEAVVAERRARAEAETANRAKDAFLATLSHELRTPLNAIMGWVRMLRAGMLSEAKAAHALEVIERNAGAQERLIGDLLDVSRVISGRLRLTVDRVDLVPIVGAAIEAVRPAAAKAGILIETELACDDCLVAGDGGRLQQVLVNLLTNAVKFTPPGGRALVRLRVDVAHAIVEVTDTGKGIAKDFLPHLFEPFRQADATFARAHGGLGLGLAIAKTLVEMHGGTVTADSDGDGRGSTFRVRLPLADTTPEKLPPAYGSRRQEAAIPVGNVGLDEARILIVEDEPDARDLVVSVLEERGATCVAVASAAEALETFPRFVPDVVVSDIGLPGEDGFSLLRKIRALPEGAKVRAAALTAYVREDDARRALEAGFDVHLSKPIDPVQLVGEVARLRERSGAGEDDGGTRGPSPGAQ